MNRQIFDNALNEHIGEIAKSFEFAYVNPPQITDAFWRNVLGSASKCELAWRRAEEGEVEDAWEMLNEIVW